MMSVPLNGIRVLDFTRVLAGPLCTMMLADLGADVIKVEQPGRGDDTRAWGPPWAGDPHMRLSAYFASVNRNKRSITLNLKHPEGVVLAHQLAAQSHVVIENFKVGQIEAIGLGPDDLHVINPALVVCSITGFGQDGPYSERPGYDYVIQAMSGLMAITGDADGEPVKVGVAISDVIAGLNAAFAILAALRHAEQTGQGQHIDVSLYDTQIAALVNVASNVLVSGVDATRYGNQHPNIVPYQTFQAADGPFVVAVGNDLQFGKLCILIDEALNEDARFATNPGRVEHRAELVERLQGHFRQRTARKWVDDLLKLGIPAGPIQTVDTALNDPHTVARGLIQSMQLPNGESLRLVGSPVHYSQSAMQDHTAPPALGQHTSEVLTEILGLDAGQLNRLAESGVI